MRHRKAGKQLSRNSSHRKALLRNMVTSLLKHESIETTDAKAKTIRPVAEKMITLAKRGDLHARRQALAYIQDNAVTHRLFDELKNRYLDRQGGYIRIIKKGVRKGDGAPISIVQLVPQDEETKTAKKKVRKSKKVSRAKAPKLQKEVAVKKEEEVAEKVQEATPPDTADEVIADEGPQTETAVKEEETAKEAQDENSEKIKDAAPAEEEKEEKIQEDISDSSEKEDDK